MFEVGLQTCYTASMHRPKFVTDEIYHVYNRGVEKRIVFSNERDYRRFIRDMEEFNDSAPAANLHRPCLKSDFKQRKPLVEIFCFCLMPNHYHFLLRQLVDGGITEFMRKIGTGYTNYFNLKNNRVGALFQGKFKAVHLEKQAHLLYLPHYIHLNPLDLKMPSWRDKKIENPQKALRFLESYRWSSYLDHVGKRNFPSVISQNIFRKFYGTPKEYRASLQEWINDMDFAGLSKVAIEEL